MKVGIIGVGVMGGSLLLKLTQATSPYSVHTMSRGLKARDWAQAHGAESAYDNISDLPHDLDFLFLTSPSHVLEAQAKELAQWPGKALISDMASAKGWIVPRLDQILGGRFLSCHPMCGSEKTGLEGAKADLYDNKTVILCPGPSALPQAKAKLTSFWEALGCRVVTKSPEEHDQAVAWVSHMPHLVVPAILQAIKRAEGDHGDIFTASGTGLRDVSRLAGSNPALWKDIFQENQTAVKQTLESMQKELQHCLNILNKKGNDFSEAMTTYLDQAREIRDRAGLGKI